MSNVDRKTGVPEHIAVSKSKGIRIDWADGHHSEFTCEFLRDECPCATCSGSHGTEPQKATYSSTTPTPSNPFQMYRPKLKMNDIEEVGNYAVRVQWNDGHNTGIYSYDYLRSICQCAGCMLERAAD